MAEFDKHDNPEGEAEVEQYPLEPRYHPVNRIIRSLYDFLASAKLAMALLVVILACCLAGTTVVREKRAWELIFSTLWFNGLLVLLIVNVACCFFGRIWRRKLTLVSLGMILFHLSFVAVFAGIIYNSLFFFRGIIRLTEGESLQNGDPRSYDAITQGRFFTMDKLRGELTLIRMHTGFMAEGMDKRAAYEIRLTDGPRTRHDTIYITRHLEYRGFKYFPEKEGYSLLTILSDRTGQELYGAHLPLQSLRRTDQTYHYTTGTREGPTAMPFPQPPVEPRFSLNVTYLPDPKKERGGKAQFLLYPLSKKEEAADKKPTADCTADIGALCTVGDSALSVREVRYWAAMAVRYEPGQPIILTSLWVGLFGVTLTTLARIFRRKPTAAPARSGEPS